MTLDEDIIIRLERAEGPDRRIDRDILRFISGRVVRDETFIYGAKHGTREIETTYPYRFSCWLAPKYTRYIDVAMTLVQQPHVSLEQDAKAEGNNAHAAVDHLNFGHAKTLPNALCIAAIKALASIEP